MGLLIYNKSYGWLFNLNLTYEALWIWTGIDFLISLLEKLILTVQINGAVVWKWMGFSLMKRYLLRSWNYLALLNWIWANVIPKKIGFLIRSMKSLSS